MMPRWSHVAETGWIPPICNVPTVGLKPTVPQYEAGLSMEPMVCVPSATGTIPQATAAAEPLEEPPGVRFASNGLLVGPDRPIANSAQHTRRVAF